MMDDFGDFLQASPAAPTSHLPANGNGGFSKLKNLDTKMIESFDLSGSNQKASFKFRQPARQVGRRPQHTYTQSASSADWKSLDLKTSEFMAPVRPTLQRQVHHSQALQHGSYHQPLAGVQVPIYQHNVSQNVQLSNFSLPTIAHVDTTENPQSQLPCVSNGTGLSEPQPAGFKGSQADAMSWFQHGNRGFSQLPMHLQLQPTVPGNVNAANPYSNMPAFSLDGTYDGQFSLRPCVQGQNQSQTTMASNTGFIGSMPGYSQDVMASTQPPNRSQTTLLVVPQSNAEGVLQKSVVNSIAQPHSVPLPMSDHQPRPVLLSQQNRSTENIDLSLPSWMTNPSEIPSLYKEVLKLCATPNSFADTSRLYPIFVSSQLPKDVLGHIWSTANQSVPGQLTFSEVYIALALIALAQNGEMNLTANYVMRLNSPPIPDIQIPSVTMQLPNNGLSLSHMPQGISSAVSGISLTMPHLSKNVQNSTVLEDDDFADFQSVAPVISPSLNRVVCDNSCNNEPDKDFHDFQSFVPDKISNPLVANSEPVSFPAYPDRSLINSPKTAFSKDVVDPAFLSQPKPLLGSIDFSKFKADSSKALHIAAKSLNIPANSSPLSPKETEISAFKVNILHLSQTACEQDDDFGAFKHASPVKLGNQVTILGDLKEWKKDSDDTNVSFNSFSVFDSPGMGPHSLNISASEAALQAGGLMDTNSSSGDKYSALRDLVPFAPDSITESAVTGNDMSQTTRGFRFSNAIDNDSISSNLVPASTGFLLSAGKSNLYKEDSQSITSLELPSLSRTISNLSIGSSSPYKGNENLHSVTPPEKIGGLSEEFTKFSSSQSSISTMPVAFKENAQVAPTELDDLSVFQSNATSPFSSGYTSPIAQAKPPPDDKLYSLHEPISPPASKRVNENRRSQELMKPMSPPKVTRFVVPRRISEADSDFGDFSSGPPPIDDDMDHQNGDFDAQDGDSSLVDFDAFGHFEEAKIESLKKKEAEFKRNQEDATAFSEFVASSIVNMKPIHGNNDASNTPSVDGGAGEESWSAFSGGGGETVEPFNDQVDLQAERLSVEISVNECELNGVHNTTWKLEATLSELEYNIPESERSKWDEEGEKLKARMEGTIGSDPMELYADHWGRCLATCKDIIISTGDILAALNSPSVCHEIVNSTRGKEFISCTSEVYGVARRIRKGMESVGLLDEDLEMGLKEIEIAWNNLLGFCPYTPSVHKTPEHCCRIPKQGTADSIRETSACGLCLLSTESSIPVGLEYGGKHYHAPCANLWLNQIAPILPRLELPSAF